MRIQKERVTVLIDCDPGLEPEYKTEGSAGMDLKSAEDCIISTGSIVTISTGLRVQIPIGYDGQIRGRSGLAFEYKVFATHSPGTIDSDYRGTIKIMLDNRGDNTYIVKKGDRIAQMIIAPAIRADTERGGMTGTNRGSGGFGSTGR